MRRAVIIESSALLVIGTFGLLGGLDSYLHMDTRMQSSSLKPGIFVLILSAGLILAALAHAYFSLRQACSKSNEPAREPGQARTNRLVFLVLGAVALYACLIPLIGYLPSTVLFLLAQFRLLGVSSWWRNAVLTSVVSAIFFLVFIHYGGMVFPYGSLFE